MSTPDVVIVGGGVIGCAIARVLAGRAVRVTVIERNQPGSEASWAAAGMLSPLAESDRPDEFLDLLIAAARHFPALSESLLAETGIDVGYRSEGTLLLSLDPEDDETLERRWQWQSAAALPVERLTADEALEMESAVAPTVRWALRFPSDHQVDNRELSTALWRSAEAAGARFLIGHAIEEVHIQAGRATGVSLAGGERVSAGAVVIAAGCWSGRLVGLPRVVPVEPVHGQLIALDGEDLSMGHVVDTPRIYLVPRRDGRIIAGATAERTGFHKEVTQQAVEELRAAAVEAVPALADRAILESWSGLRPGTPDDAPIVGADPEVANLYYATGHFRNGILLAPITAEAVAALITGDTPPPKVAPFGIERFM